MAVLSLHREPSPSRAREAWSIRALIRSVGASAKTKVPRPLHVLSFRPKPCPKPAVHKPAVHAASATAPIESTPHLNTSTTDPDPNLAPSPTYASDATTIRPAVTVRLDPEKANRDSGVALPPNECTNARHNTELIVDFHEKSPRPRSPRPKSMLSHAEAAPPRALESTNTRTPAIVAARSLDIEEGPTTPGAQLSPSVLHLFLQNALSSMTAMLRALHRGDVHDSYNSKGVMYYGEVVAALQTLLRYSGADKALGLCGKPSDACKSLAVGPAPRFTAPPTPLPIDMPFGDSTQFPFPAYGETRLPVTTVPNQGHAQSQGSRPSSNGQKRPPPNQGPAGEEPKRQRRPGGGRGGRSNQNGDDGNERGTDLHPTESVRDSARLFACPFYKHDPIPFRECLFRHTSTKTNYLKQHLRRRHLQPIHCPICGQTFDAESRREDHIRAQICQPREFYHEGLTTEQTELLGKTHKNASPAERWFQMWDAIFPDEPRPASPYVRDPWVEVVDISWREYAGRGVLGQMQERENIVISRPGHPGQNGSPEVWDTLRRDMVSDAQNLVDDVPLVDPPDDQQGSVLDNDPPSQHQTGRRPAVPALTLRTSPGVLRPQLPYGDSGDSGDSGVYFPPTRSPSSTGRGGRRGGRNARPKLMQVQAQPSFASPVPQEDWLYATPEGVPPWPSAPGMFTGNGFDFGSMNTPVSSVPPGTAPSMERSVSHQSAPFMDRSFSHQSLPGRITRGVGMGMGMGDGQGAGEMRSSFQGFSANSQNRAGQGGGQQVGMGAGLGGFGGGTPSLPGAQGLPGFRQELDTQRMPVISQPETRSFPVFGEKTHSGAQGNVQSQGVHDMQGTTQSQGMHGNSQGTIQSQGMQGNTQGTVQSQGMQGTQGTVQSQGYGNFGGGGAGDDTGQSAWGLGQGEAGDVQAGGQEELDEDVLSQYLNAQYGDSSL